MSIKERLNGVTIIKDKELKLVMPAPKSVKIELTTACNFKCKYCAYSFREDNSNKEIDWELFKNITTQMKEVGVEEIGTFLIGEPFMSPALLVKAIEWLKKDLEIPYVFLTSNASLATPQVVKACFDVGLDSLKWSCNAANSEQFEQMMGVDKRMLDRAIINIKTAHWVKLIGKYKTKLYASSIMYTPEQPKLAEEFLEHNIKPYVDEHYWLPLYTMGGVAKDNEKELGFNPIAGNTGRVDNPVPAIPCWTLFTAGHVLADGRMTACCADGTGYWEVGDLNKISFMEAWNSEEFQKLRQAHLENKIICSKCEKCALY